ncbi:putative proline-specific permease put4 [Exophiala dermatitidis]|uniref:AAT family amino acid transporter n=1 Tax=Exophiala dermatitidis (strain ATCC 34100 / CBS 525.76 / NIH/UT8656) TaxID=858893 RepID=H6BK52_EXODN|nr:AAT family amino acid transporter [Exophiala dermatitidis NIH/UT8656]EHY53315.1 AAT family amino acid transporter [Exophiala dermatitidis NIH/UT8656]
MSVSKGEEKARNAPEPSFPKMSLEETNISEATGQLEASMVPVTGTKQTLRHLRPRHIQLMAFSGAIGTGLFVGSGSALARAGPLGLFLGYSIYALLVWSTFNAVGEMVVWLPIDSSFVVFAHAFLDDAWGFALGWLYTVTNALSAAGEVAAVAAIFNFWTVSVNNALYVAIVSTSLVALNIFGVRIYGEGEFYFSLFKIILILGLLLMTFILMVGGNPQHDAFGFRYWKDPGPFNEYIASGSWGKYCHFLGFWSVFVQAAFAFGGPDYIALCAGEARAPRRVMPSVFKRVIYRLALFYILGVLAAGIMVPSDDPNLGSSKPGAGASPFVIGITRLKIPVLPHIINAMLLTSAWSCALELFYASTRSLYALAVDGKTPRFLLFTWRGVPTFCVVAVWIVTWISFMSASNGSLTVFTWLTSIVGSGNLLIYSIFHITYIRFRLAQKAQGIRDDQRPWFRRYQYYYSIVSLFFYLIIFFTNGFSVFTKGNWSTANFIFAYFSFGLFLVTYVGYKLIKRPRMSPLKAVPLHAGRHELDMDDGYVEKEPVTALQKFNRWLWG